LIKRTEKFERRDNYELAPPQDRFIVQLLRVHIDQVLSTYTKSDSLHPRVLDVGCGRQPFRRELEKLGYQYFSIDVHQNPEQAVDVLCEIDQQLPSELLDLGTFDFIICTEVLEHVVDWDTTFNNLTKLLARNGRLFITCPYIYQLHEEPYDFWRATPYTLQHFGNKFGIKVIHQVNAGDAWDVLGTVLANFHTEPVSRSLSHRIINRLISKGQKFLLKLLLNGHLQKILKAKGTLYQANIIVFKK
jgi:SAM-dependent methyltransferase